MLTDRRTATDHAESPIRDECAVREPGERELRFPEFCAAMVATLPLAPILAALVTVAASLPGTPPLQALPGWEWLSHPLVQIPAHFVGA